MLTDTLHPEVTRAPSAVDSEALLLVNMGGPANTGEVKPYLRAIFADPLILPVPGALRGLVGGMIVAKRATAVAERYELIGGSSPLLGWTERLVAAMTDAANGSAPVIAHAYRYTSPTIGEAIGALARDGIQRITLLPLFPHETRAMTGSIRMEATRQAAAHGIELRTVPAWGLHPAVLSLQREYLAEALREAGDGARVLFVAHGIPMRDVRRGDPYPEQVATNAHRLADSLPDDTDWALAYQSRVGPVKWTEPYLEDELARLQASDAPVVIMPLSFVADCLETLYDLDQVAAPTLRSKGVRCVVRVPAYNDDPRFAEALTRVVQEVF